MHSKGKPITKERANKFPSPKQLNLPVGPSEIELHFRGLHNKPLTSEIILIYAVFVRSWYFNAWDQVAIKEAEMLFGYALEEPAVSFYARARKLPARISMFDLLMLSHYFVQRGDNIYEFDLTEELISVLSNSGQDESLDEEKE